MSRLINHQQSFRGAEETLWTECSPETQNWTGWLSFCDLTIQFVPCLWSDPGCVMHSRRSGCTAPHWEWTQINFPFPSTGVFLLKGSQTLCLFVGLGACSCTSQVRQPCHGGALLGSLKQQVLTDRGPFPGLSVSVLLHCDHLNSFQIAEGQCKPRQKFCKGCRGKKLRLWERLLWRINCVCHWTLLQFLAFTRNIQCHREILILLFFPPIIIITASSTVYSSAFFFRTDSSLV